MTEDDNMAKLVGYPPEEILDYTIQDIADHCDSVFFYLPYRWSETYGGEFKASDGIGNPAPNDPLTIYWTADVNGCDQRLTYKTTIGALLDDVFEGHRLIWEEPNMIGADSVPLFTEFRDALQKEIDKLSSWIANAKPKE